MKRLVQKTFIVALVFSVYSCKVESQSESQASEEIIEKSDMKESKEMPEDIIWKLKNDFKNKDDFQKALSIIEYVRADVLNVGWIQLSRSMIIIADGDLNKLQEIIDSQYHGDPRDVIMEMMSMPEINNDHGMTPFK